MTLPACDTTTTTASDDARRTPPPIRTLLVQAGPSGTRVSVTVTGEFCLDNSQALRRALADALARSEEGVDLDLGELDLADCSALNVLLAARRDALAVSKTITLTAARPAAQRLLTYTGTLFSPAHDHTATEPDQTPGAPYEDTDDGLLRTEVVQLRRAMRTRPDIDLARGILMATFHLNPDEAWNVLVTASQNTNTKLHRLAKDVVTTVHGTPLPDPVQKHLTAAVARTRTTASRPQPRTRTHQPRHTQSQGHEPA
ncbi:ANTAR domain-containing protein [Streptomyces monashensis]|uniref:ANTAR domain-containing protein n=1 Tax=Streptomyces monashensis TaxID=1678012 RepID=UPI0033FBF593